MIVLDTSVAVELLLNLPLASKVRSRLSNPDIELHAPHLLIVEVLQVLRRRVAAGVTTNAQAQTALRFLEDLDVNYHDHLILAQRAWDLRENLTAYDAMYVALAEVFEAPLLTSDKGLARAPGHHATIDLLEA